MKFIFNKFPKDNSFKPEEEKEWIPLKESTNLWICQLQALPFLVINVVVILLLMNIIGVEFDFDSTYLIIGGLAIVPIHEFIHALFFPEKLNSENIYFGFILKGGAFFAAYIGEIKKERFILCLLAPLFLISFSGLLFLHLFGGYRLIEHIILFNALASCVDCLNVFIISRQVPGRAIMKNQEIRSYWRVKNQG